jgi:hypothetical protein
VLSTCFFISIRDRRQPRCRPRSRRKASDALPLRSHRLDPIGERLHELLQDFAGAVAGELPMFIEKLVDMANIGASGCCGTFRNTGDCLR